MPDVSHIAAIFAVAGPYGRLGAQADLPPTTSSSRAGFRSVESTTTVLHRDPRTTPARLRIAACRRSDPASSADDAEAVGP